MQKTTLKAVTLFTLFTIPQAVLAGSITYDIVNYPDLQNGWTLSGTITTDGTTGTIQSSDITSWTWTVTMDGTTHTYQSTDPGAMTVTQALMASNTGLYLSPLGGLPYIELQDSGHVILQDQLIKDYTEAGPDIGIQTLAAQDGQAFWLRLLDAGFNQTYQFYVAGGVPEPASLYLLGIGAVCGSVFVMGHKRRERRAATTDG